MPTVVGVGAAVSGTGTIAPAFPGGYTAVADDIAVTFTECNNTDTLTPPAGWALINASTVASGTTTKLSAIWKRIVGGDTAPTIADAGDHLVGRMIIVRGCVTTGNPWDIATPTTELTADTTVSIPAVTTTVPDCLILAAFATGQDVASTAGATSWVNLSLAAVTERMDDWSSQGRGGGFATLSLTANFKAQLKIALKGAVAAATPPGLVMARHL